METIWKDEYSVGVKEIDEQHKHFIALLNIFHNAISENKGRKELSALFQEVSNCAEEHFSTEEKYFDKFNYEGSAEHKLKHKEIREEIKKLKNQETENKMEFDVNVAYFLKNWLDNHLKDMDQKYKECFKKNGLI